MKKLSELRHNQDFLKYFFNTSWLMVNQFAKLIVGLLIGIWVTRYLGPEQFGIYSYALSFSVLFKTLAAVGLNSIVVRDLVKYEDKRDKLLGTTYGLKLIGSATSIILLAVLLLILPNIEWEIKLYIFIIVFGTAFTSLQVIDFYFQAKVLSKQTVFAGLISLSISSIIKIILILSEAPLLAFVCVVLFDGLSLGLGYLYFYKKSGLDIRRWEFDKKLAKSLFSESWPMIFSGLAISVGLRIDQIMLHEYVSLENLGLYAVGVRMAEIFTFLPLIITQSMFPKIVEFDSKNEQKKTMLLTRYIFFLLCIAALVITFIAKFMVILLYGSDFIVSHEVLQILIWTIPFTYLGIISNKLLIIRSHQKIVFWKQLLLLVINISLNLILIPKYGIIGSAWATLIADIAINLFIDLFFNKTRWIFYMKVEALLLIPLKR